MHRAIIVVCFFVLLGCSPKHEKGSNFYLYPYSFVQPNFDSIKANVIDRLCLDCHTGVDAPHGLVFDSYESIMNSDVFPPLVNAGEPQNSSFFTSIINSSMPKDRRPLVEQEVEAIRAWIKNGAKKEETVLKPEKPPVETPPNEPCDDFFEDCDGSGDDW